MDDEFLFRSALSRRRLLATAGVTGAGAALGSLLGPQPALAGTRAPLRAGPGPAGDAPSAPVPAVNGLHVQFGADPATEVVVSWHTLSPIEAPRVLLGRDSGAFERSVGAATRSYVDAKSGQTVYVQHASLGGLRPDEQYAYAATHAGAEPEVGSFRTAPRGRTAFTFTSFGDQGTPTVGKRYTPPAGVERIRPLLHLFNGDLCYANLAENRVRTWSDFWENNSRSARHRPWMPAPGNHENERGNGPIGYQAYQTWFELPAQPGQIETTRGLWYAFTVGSVRFVSLANDDVCYQDGGDSYVRGYSGGAQRTWLEGQLRDARRDRNIDWIVVCMHQVAISTADKFNGADLGIRQEWLPLFDRYGVDLVVCGHEHHYERSHPLRGAQPNSTLTPVPADTRTDVIDTSKGTVHMVLGGGGTSAPSNQLFFTPPACRVITAVGAPDAQTGKRPPVYVQEPAPWSAVRNAAHSYGFAAFDVDPGTVRGGVTRMRVTYYDVVGAEGALQPFETFTLQRPRNDR